MTEGDPGCVSQTSPSTAHFTYVDNLGALGTDQTKISNVMTETQNSFDSIGLNLHDIGFNVGGGDALGIVLDGKRLETRNSQKRYSMLRKVFQQF